MQLKIFKMFAVETSHGDKTKKSFELLSGVFHTAHFFYQTRLVGNGDE